MTPLPTSIDDTAAQLLAHDYVAERSLATAVYLALKLQRPLFLEGEPGTGKTEIAKTLAAMLKRPLIRLQCHEGLDLAGAAYEWNYARQMLEIRLAEQIVAFVQRLRALELYKLPGIAETIEWTRALIELDAIVLDPETVGHTLGVLLKYQDDIAKLQGAEAQRLVDEVKAATA